MNHATRKELKEIGFSGDSGITSDCTTTEEMETVYEDQIEECMREQIELWLANHGSKLFQLECSKYFTKQNKTANYKPYYNPGRPSAK